MRKFWIFCLLISASFKSYTQSNHHHNSFYVSTDALCLLNSIIQSDLSTLSVSGEICIDHTYGLLINAFMENEHVHIYNRKGLEFSPEFRWYLGGEECSAFHLGGYLTFGAAKIIKDDRFANTFLRYEESTFGGGIAAGYKVLLRDRWTINPAFYVGVSNRYKLHVEEAYNSWPLDKESDSEVKIVLAIGYRIK
jgi:hypothetical protein